MISRYKCERNSMKRVLSRCPAHRSMFPSSVPSGFVCSIYYLVDFEITIYSTIAAMSSQVGTIYRHDENYVPISRWSEFVSLKDEADELEVRMATKDIVHRLAGCEGSWYVSRSIRLGVSNPFPLK